MEVLIPILLIVAGFLLILVEIYVVPGFNVVGVLGFLLIIFAVGYFYLELGWMGGSIALSASTIFGAVFFWLVYRSGAWQRFVLSTTLNSGSSRGKGEMDYRRRFLGRTGIAITSLRPIGTAEVDGKRIEVTTEGEFIAKGSEIRVVAMNRQVHVVRLAENSY